MAFTKALAFALLLPLGLSGSVALAETARSVYVPISFRTESETIRTSACLEVAELINSQLGGKLDSGFAAADHAFEAVIAAIKRRDHDALLQLSDPQLGRAPKKFDLQASAYFQQFEKIELLGVARVYRLDGLVIYLAKLQFSGRPLFAPFAFTYSESGVAFFLPYDTDIVSRQLLEGWLRAKWGPSNTEAPAYCDSSIVARANHRFALQSPASAVAKDAHPTFLMLNGAPIDTPGALKDSALQVESAVGAIDATLASNKMEEFFNLLPPSAAQRARSTLVSASSDERERFKETITQQKPFFVFDASPLFVVYTKSSAGLVRVMYFTFDTQHRLVWTDSSLATPADRVFKFGPLFAAASTKVPFANMATK